jgi:hypothetical protein
VWSKQENKKALNQLTAMMMNNLSSFSRWIEFEACCEMSEIFSAYKSPGKVFRVKIFLFCDGKDFDYFSFAFSQLPLRSPQGETRKKKYSEVFLSLTFMNDLWKEWNFARSLTTQIFFIFYCFILEKNLTLNNEKSALISLLDGCDEFVAIDDIDVSSSSIFLQMSSSFVAFDVLVVGGNTANKENNWELIMRQVNWITTRTVGGV